MIAAGGLLAGLVYRHLGVRFGEYAVGVAEGFFQDGLMGTVKMVAGAGSIAVRYGPASGFLPKSEALDKSYARDREAVRLSLILSHSREVGRHQAQRLMV